MIIKGDTNHADKVNQFHIRYRHVQIKVGFLQTA